MMYGLFQESVDSERPMLDLITSRHNVCERCCIGPAFLHNHRSKRIKGVDQAEADKHVASHQYAANKYEITPYLTDKLNHVAYEDTYKLYFQFSARGVNLTEMLKNFNSSTIKEWL